MNVAKNWALTIMLIALAFAHFSSELSLKEQMFVPVKKMLNDAGHIDAKLIDFSEISPQNPAKSAVFYWLFLGKVFPRNFPWNRPIFLRLCPWKSFEIWPFCAKIPRNQPIFPRILTFFPRKSRKSADFSTNFDLFPAKIPRNRLISPRICPWESREILLFFPRNIRSPVHMKKGPSKQNKSKDHFHNENIWLQLPELIWFCSLTVEPQIHITKGRRTGKIMFALWSHYTEILFHIFSINQQTEEFW